MEQVDAVVVGSGFGGSVSAARLAEAGRRRAGARARQGLPAGLVPAQPARDRRATSGTRARGCTGCSTSGRSAASTPWSSSGLGGGSLIYANVLLRKDEQWFVHEARRRRRVRGLAGHPGRPRAALRPRRADARRGSAYPFDASPVARPRKTARDAGRGATRLRPATWQLPPLAVTLRARRARAAGAADRRARAVRRTSTACPARPAACAASATSAATTAPRTRSTTTTSRRPRTHGADIRTCHEVRTFAPRAGGGYEVALRRATTADAEGTRRRPACRTGGDLRPARARGRHLRHDVPAAAQPRSLPGLSAAPGHALLRQRRPARRFVLGRRRTRRARRRASGR